MYGVPNTYLSVEEYWEALQINECAGYGIRQYPTTGVTGLGCGDFWDQKNRYWLAWSIAKSEKRLESDRWLGYPLRRKYEKPRQLAYSFPVYLGKYVRGCGVQTETTVDSVSLDLRTGGVINDPVTFTVNVDFTDADELLIKYPSSYFLSAGDDYTIRPSYVSISGGVASVEIPRCRLLLPEYFVDFANDNERPSYNDDTNFLQSVDVVRNYLNTGTGTNLVWWRHKGQVYGNTDIWTCESALASACSDVRQLACPYIPSQREGFVQLEPATYDDGYTKTSYAVKREPDGIEINFMRGFYDRYQEMDEMIIRAVIAIAHNNLPQDYCSCDQQTLYYKRDTKPIEPPIRLGLGASTWGLYEAEQIIREFDKDRLSHNGGLL